MSQEYLFDFLNKFLSFNFYFLKLTTKLEKRSISVVQATPIDQSPFNILSFIHFLAENLIYNSFSNLNASKQASSFPQRNETFSRVVRLVLMLFCKLLLFHCTLSETFYLRGFASLFLQVFI